jgi:hypothetical protein
MDFEGIRGWFNLDDQVSFWKTVALYCQEEIDELRSGNAEEDTYKLCCWIEKKKEAESMITKLEDW